MRCSATARHRGILLQAMVIVALVLAAAACGGDDDDDAGGGNPTQPANSTLPADATEAPGNDGGSTASGAGTVTVGETTWTVNPDRQCSVFPGPVVAIAGVAAEDPQVEITIDYDEAAGPTAVWVRDPGASAIWSAEGDQVTFEIEGSTVRGSGTFYNWTTGDNADGSFDVRC